MNHFLAKTEPNTYSIDRLETDQKTIWDGVSNPQAVRAIREMQIGDKVFIYHGSGESAVVGLARVAAGGRPDPKNPKSAVAEFEFLAKRYISTVLALFLGFSALLFLIVVRNSVRSNLLRHESMLAAYFGIYAVCYFAVNMGWAKKTLANNYMLSALTLCLVIWISVFRPGTELAHD